MVTSTTGEQLPSKTITDERLADLVASCIFQSETGGHADEYVSFLCDLASACMELKALRAAHGPATTESPRGLVMDHLRGLVADHDNRVASGVMPEWGSPIRAHKTVIEAMRAFLRAADEPTSVRASNEQLAQALRNLRDVAHREVSPRYSAALDKAFTLADIALGEFDSEGEVSRGADVGPGGGVRATHATGSAPSKPGAAEPPSEIPHELFDGYSVLQELTQQQRLRTSPENVSDVLDAAVRLMRRMRQPSTKSEGAS